MRFVIARWVMKHRALVLAGFTLVTLAFMAGLPRVDIRTIFNDLLPVDDPYVQIYFDHRNFGNPLTMSVMIEPGPMPLTRMLAGLRQNSSASEVAISLTYKELFVLLRLFECGIQIAISFHVLRVAFSISRGGFSIRIIIGFYFLSNSSASNES